MLLMLLLLLFMWGEKKRGSRGGGVFTQKVMFIDSLRLKKKTNACMIAVCFFRVILALVSKFYLSKRCSAPFLFVFLQLLLLSVLIQGYNLRHDMLHLFQEVSYCSLFFRQVLKGSSLFEERDWGVVWKGSVRPSVSRLKRERLER